MPNEPLNPATLSAQDSIRRADADVDAAGRPISPCDCKHDHTLFVQSHRSSPPSQRHSVYVCADCGEFHVSGMNDGAHFRVHFTLPTDELAKAAGQYVKFLSASEAARSVPHPEPQPGADGKAGDWKRMAIKLAAFCCRIHGLSPGHCDEPVPLAVREEAIRLCHEFKEVDRAEARGRRSTAPAADGDIDKLLQHAAITDKMLQEIERLRGEVERLGIENGDYRCGYRWTATRLTDLGRKLGLAGSAFNEFGWHQVEEAITAAESARQAAEQRIANIIEVAGHLQPTDIRNAACWIVAPPHLEEPRPEEWEISARIDQRSNEIDRVEKVINLCLEKHFAELKTARQAAESKLARIEAGVKADADDLAEMRDGTKLTRAGLVACIVYANEDAEEHKAARQAAEAERDRLRLIGSKLYGYVSADVASDPCDTSAPHCDMQLVLDAWRQATRFETTKVREAKGAT